MSEIRIGSIGELGKLEPLVGKSVIANYRSKDRRIGIFGFYLWRIQTTKSTYGILNSDETGYSLSPIDHEGNITGGREEIRLNPPLIISYDIF